jgi:hypothetical protein
VFALGLVWTLAFGPASHASPLTFNVTNGTFTSGGTFSGTYTINSTNDMITGGQFTITDFGQTFTSDWIHSYPYGPGNPDTQGDFSGGPGGGLFYFDTSNSLTAPVLCTYANESTCGEGDSTQIWNDPFGDIIDGATGATITPAVSPIPEPSSLILLATGTLGVVALARRRMRLA